MYKFYLKSPTKNNSNCTNLPSWRSVLSFIKFTYLKNLKNCNISENSRADNISIMSSLDDETNETVFNK